ncbi:MAG: four helix bundle protein [candidate division WOR-3 bacterium]|nr:four helix bundle protein [candidate division WOR-3 bacterium]
MGRIERFEDIEAWKNARELVKQVYQVTRKAGFARDFGLRDQIQRAAVSVMSNIAEGFERGSNKEFKQFLFIARGSAGEVRSLAYAARDLEYLDDPEFRVISDAATTVSKQVASFIHYLQKTDYDKS